MKLEYVEEDLRAAVAASTSWREVMRALGFRTTNGYTARRIKSEAEQAGMDTTHFQPRGPRSTVTDTSLKAALADAHGWTDVFDALGLAYSTGNKDRARKRADMLGVPTDHLDAPAKPCIGEVPFDAEPTHEALRAAGSALAAGWFAARGYAVSLPVEPRPYDLVVEASSALHRVQVKTATGKDSSGEYICRIARVPRRDGRKVAYTSEEIDFFFVVDGDFRCYIVPFREVATQTTVTVSTIRHRQVPAIMPC